LATNSLAWAAPAMLARVNEIIVIATLRNCIPPNHLKIK